MDDILQLMMIFARTSTRAPETVLAIKTLDDYHTTDEILLDYGIGTSGPRILWLIALDS